MWHIRPRYSRKAAVTQHWWIAGAFRRPIGIANHSYRPKGVVTAVKCISSGWTLVWKNELVISITLQILPFTQSARISSIRGSGWESVTVFEFKARKLFTRRSSMRVSALGTKKVGDACAELEGRIRPASRFFVGSGWPTLLCIFGECCTNG